MPKITAPSVAEHVAQQEAAVFDAAITLFIERGYDNVSLGDIAQQVGLARNSLYRYFPDKAHIMIRWFRSELPLQVAIAADALSGDETLAERIRRYVDAQLDYAATPAHGLISSLIDLVPSFDDAVRAEVMASHRDLLAPLDDALASAGVRDQSERGIIADLTQGLINAGADRESRTGRDERARARIVEATLALLDQGKATRRRQERTP